MEVEDVGQGSGKKPAKITIKFKDKECLAASYAFGKASDYAFGKAECYAFMNSQKQAKTQAIPSAKLKDKTQAAKMKAKLKAKPSTKHSISQCMCSSYGPSKKTKISKNRKPLGSGSSAADDELKRKADEEAATKARAEEEDAIRKSKEKTTKKKIKEAKREARKKLAKKKQPEKDTEENVSDNEEENDDNEEDADNNKEDDEKEEDADNNEEYDDDEEDAENEKDADNEEDAENEKNADNEEDADNNEELLRIPTLRSWNTTTMKKRIKMETETRCLGKLEHHEEFNPEEEQDGMNVYKGLDVYVAPINDKEPETKEEYYAKIVLKFDIISDERSELVRTLLRMTIARVSLMEKQDADKDENAEKEKAETKKEKQDKVDKVDNIQEKQGDDKDEIGEDEFWNTQFTDSQCEELENQANEEIKKNKTTKKKSVIEMTPPSFSLDLSTDTNKVEERAAKRAKKPSRFIVSPYINKKTATKGKAVQDEMMICNYLFSMEGSELDFIFETKEGNATIRDYMQTLAPTLKIESNVIDTYCLVLNHEQGMNSKGKKTKHFFHTGMITKDMFNWKKEDEKKYDEVKQYKAFYDTIKNEFKTDDELKKIKDLEMAFFPIIAHEHYYLVVFNFLKGTTVIIDNLKTLMTYEAKYKEVCDVLHPRGKDVLNKKPTILRPKWGTKENNTDCGVFLMMHMENYNGENARIWNLEFPTEEKGNKYDIIKMRMRFAAKMLTHEINIHREEISKQALEFVDRNKEKKAREVLLLEAIRVKKQKQDSERVSSAM
ncbi:ulp1 protease family, C-terminal catalytic domain-containing protein [Tanacetum coccineum]